MKSLGSAVDPGDEPRARGARCVQAFREQFDFVYRCVQRHGVRGAEVDDIVQEVFIAMWRRWSDFDDTRPLRPWLAGIAFRVARSHLRRRRPDGVPIVFKTGGEAPGMEVADVNELPAQTQQHDEVSETRELVVTALARLPERYRSPLVLHDLDDVSPNEIARLLELPLATVYTRLRRARLAFAKIVEELNGPRPAAAQARVLAPVQLLALERSLPPAPGLVRVRAEAFADSVVRLRTPPPDPLAGEALAQIGRGSAGAIVASMAAVLLVVAVLLGLDWAWSRRSTARSPVTGTHWEPVARTPTGSAIPPRSVPVFQSPPVAGAPRFSPVVAKELGEGLTGYWPMDDGPGARLARDHSGADRHCRFHGPRGAKRVWIPGVAGRALALNATTWLDCPQPEVAREAAVALTISAWVKRRSPQSPAAVVTRQIGTGYLDHFFLGFKADSVRVLSHAWDGRLIVTVPPSLERWHHLAFTREREGTTRLYLDGVEVAQENTGPQEIGRISTPITIGAGRFSPSPHKVRQHFDGAVDEVLAYGRALSAMEVRALAAGVRPMLPAP